jgi:hypothetical protein
MSAGKHSFKLNDSRRLMRAAIEVGLQVRAVTLYDGKVTVLIGDVPDGNGEAAMWDTEIEKLKAKKQPGG